MLPLFFVFASFHVGAVLHAELIVGNWSQKLSGTWHCAPISRNNYTLTAAICCKYRSVSNKVTLIKDLIGHVSITMISVSGAENIHQFNSL